MKRFILISLVVLWAMVIQSAEITDALWLKAVQLKKNSLNVYPITSEYRTIMKNKKGEVEEDQIVIISHREENGKIINSFVSGKNSDGKVSADDGDVKAYLEMDVIAKDESVFKSTESKDFKLKRLANEVVNKEELAKYSISMITESDGKAVKSDGFAWLNKTTGVPVKLLLDIDLNKTMIKKLTSVTSYDVTEAGYLVSTKSETEIEVSIVFKKMFITQIMSHKDFRKLK